MPLAQGREHLIVIACFRHRVQAYAVRADNQRTILICKFGVSSSVGDTLERVLIEFIEHYHEGSTAPRARPAPTHEPAGVIPLTAGPVERGGRLGGLLHEYHRAA